MSRKTSMTYFLCCLFLSVFATSCAYPISQEYRREAKPELTFAMVHKDPAPYKGDVVIWGGMIIKTVNTENLSSIYVLETPLGFREKPESSEYSQGRFIAESGSYLDPLVYRYGRRVTVAGVVSGSSKVISPNKKMTYTYPVIQIKEIKLWKRHRVYPYLYYDYPYYYPYYPYYDEWGYWPYWYGFGGFEFEGGEGFEHRGEGRFERGGGEERGEQGGGRR
jgi:outer membrane lipoprotein